MSIAISAVVVLIAAGIIYRNRKVLVAQARKAENETILAALRLDAAVHAKEANVKSIIRAEVEKAFEEAKAELETVGVDTKAVLAKAVSRIRSVL